MSSKCNNGSETTDTISDQTTSTGEEELEEQIRELEFQIDLSIRYHMKLQSFYLFWHKFITLFTTIFGASSFIILIAGVDSLAATITTGIVSLLTILELHIGFIYKYSLHNELYKKFIELDKKLQLIKANPSKNQFNKILTKILNISRKELPLYKGLNMICHNESCDVLGYQKERIHIPKSVWLFYNYLPFDTWIPEKINPPKV